MGREKDEMLRKQQAAHEAAQRDGRRCAHCNAVIPYGETPGGQNKLCVSCYSSMQAD
jgi:hypothetical protein